jgi:hypothetical protein
MGFKKVIVAFLSKQFTEVPKTSPFAAKESSKSIKTSKTKKLFVKVEDTTDIPKSSTPKK